MWAVAWITFCGRRRLVLPETVNIESPCLEDICCWFHWLRWWFETAGTISTIWTLSSAATSLRQSCVAAEASIIAELEWIKSGPEAESAIAASASYMPAVTFLTSP